MTNVAVILNENNYIEGYHINAISFDGDVVVLYDGRAEGFSGTRLNIVITNQLVIKESDGVISVFYENVELKLGDTLPSGIIDINPLLNQPPTEIELLKEQVQTQQTIIDELLFEVIPSLLSKEEEML